MRDKYEVEFDRAMKDLARVGGTKGLSDASLNIAEGMRDEMRAKAPLGEEITFVGNHEIHPGDLRRGIVAKKFKSRGESLSFVAIDYSIAPHAHWVEYGHGGPRPAKAHKYFRPVADRYIRGEYFNKMRPHIEKEIDKAWR